MVTSGHSTTEELLDDEELTGTEAEHTGDEPALTADNDAEEVRRTGTGRHRLLLSGAVVLIVALLTSGAGLLVRAGQLRDTPATADHALTDTEGTSRVIGDVSSALGTVFSYGPDNTARTKEEAGRLLGGKALQQYAALYGQVEKQAENQKLTLTTHVVRAGVTRLSGTGAHLLVFLDQVYERRGKTATTAAAQLSVTAELRDGHWRIVDLTSR